MAFFCFVPIVAIAAGVGSLTPGGWEERYFRLLGNAFGVPVADSVRPLIGRYCGEFLVELKERDDFDKVTSDPFVKSIYDRLARRFEYEMKIAAEKNNGRFDYTIHYLDAAKLEIKGRDRSGHFVTSNYQDHEHHSAFEGHVRLDHSIALEDIFAFDIAESATGQWMPQLDDETTDGRIYLEKLRASVAMGTALLTIGRDKIAWGYSRSGDFLLSDNAGPYDAIRLQGYRPFQLPWYFSYLGFWHPNAFIAQIQGNRKDHDHPYLLGMRINWSPWPWIEGSIARTMMFLGEGRPAMGAEDFGNALIGRNEHTYGGPSDTNGLFEADIRLHLGFLKRWVDMGSLILYYEFGSESFARNLTKAYVTGNIVGAEYDDTRWGIWGEWTDTLHDQVAWYSHYVYTDGYTQDGKIIGNPVGAFGRDTRGGLWFFATPDIEIDLQGNYTTHAGRKFREEDRRIQGEMGINLNLPHGFRMTLSGGYARTDVTGAEESTKDIFGRTLVEWSFMK